MAVDIKIRRGTQAQLPTLDLAEPGFTTDTKSLYIGDGVGNVKIGKSTLLELTDTPSTYDTGKYLQSTAAGSSWVSIGSSTTFSGLSDTPSGYEVGKYLKSTTNGSEWYDLNNDYYTESEVDTISGSLNAKINNNAGSKIIQCYNNTTTDCNVVTPVAVPFNGEDFKDTLYTHSLVTNNSRIEVEQDGIYNISYQLNFDNSINSRTSIRSRIRVNGTTYLDRGAAHSYMRSTTDDKATNNATFLWELSANNYIEIMCDRQGSSGTANTIPNQSSITLNIVRYT